MNVLVDTNVISELTRRLPDPNVIAWMASRPEETLFLSVITVGELLQGALQLPAGNRRRTLLKWVGEAVQGGFDGRILPIDQAVVVRWAEIQARARNAGLPLPVVDSLIAATASVHGLVVATRNRTDFADTGVGLVDPWNPSARA